MKERNALKVQGLIPLVVLIVAVAFLVKKGLFASRNADLSPLLLVPTVLLVILWTKGLFVVQPNEARVLTFFGNYTGSVKESGFWFANPFASKQFVSLKIGNFQSPQLKVNDAHGNPIEIAAVIVWRVVDTAKAMFDVTNYTSFVHIQCETALRQLANHFPYEPHVAGEVALRSHPEEIAKKLQAEVQQRVELAGVEVLEAQLTHLAYSPEIAQAMLRRQQAAAVIAARQMIVEGAVGMVEMALKKLESDSVVKLNDQQKATMVNNLMISLVSESHTQPVITTGQVSA